MGMGIGIHAEHPDVGKVQGCQEPVACAVGRAYLGIPAFILSGRMPMEHYMGNTCGFKKYLNGIL